MPIKTKYIVERVWTHKKLRCVVLMTPMGHRCGYVGVPKNHPFHGIEYDEKIQLSAENTEALLAGEVDVDKIGAINLFCLNKDEVSSGLVKPTLLFRVHGGLTYSGKAGSYPIHGDFRWFGYDCGHYGDAKDLNIIRRLSPESEPCYALWSDGILRDLPYCIDECNSLADQLAVFSLKEEE